MKPITLVLLTVTLALTLVVLPAPHLATAQGDGGRIAFVSDRDGNEEIYVMNPDGSGITRLTNDPANDTTPAWSPDGTRIAFSSDRKTKTDDPPNRSDIYVMNADGSGVTRLTSLGGAFDPAWSPDGTRIAFTLASTNEMGGNSTIFVMNADGSHAQEWNVETVKPDNPAAPMHWAEGDGTMSPVWSPDGTRIVFTGSACVLCYDVYVANVDGSHTIRVSPEEGGFSPTWSPDGTRIAFFSGRGRNGYSAISIVHADGSNLTTVINNLSGAQLTWSPDGTRMAFCSNDPNNITRSNIYVMRADGSGVTKLTDGSYNCSPNWSRPTGIPAPATDARTFPETGNSIAGRIRSYWEQNGGLPVFGYPITSQQAETIEGQSVQTQWFERNRLELHPENKAPYDVLLGRLGADRLAQRGYDWPSVPHETAQPGCRYFSETGRNVCGDILMAWRANGLNLDWRRGFNESENLALFGLPLTGLISEKLSDGRDYQVQYFERARFELHPENKAPYTVLLGLLGNEVRGK